jgi:O-antigen/teichoic acid export membrane protein
MAGVAGEGNRPVLELWHDTTVRIASLIFPLTALLLLMARGIIVSLFTSRYLASVPIFSVWCLMMLPLALAVDAVLRVYAQTRFLLVMNAVRLAGTAGLIGWFMSTFGLTGAVLATLVTTSVVKAAAVLKIARLMHVGIGDVLPWKRLAVAAGHAAVAAVPAWGVLRISAAPIPATLAMSAAAYGTFFAAIWLVRMSRPRPAGRTAVPRGLSICPTEEV